MSRDVRLFDDSAPELGLLDDKGFGLGRRAGGGLQIELCEECFYLRAVLYLGDRFVEFVDNRLWCLWRGGNGVEGPYLKPLMPISSSVGMLGSCGSRFNVATAKMWA